MFVAVDVYERMKQRIEMVNDIQEVLQGFSPVHNRSRLVFFFFHFKLVSITLILSCIKETTKHY